MGWCPPSLVLYVIEAIGARLARRYFLTAEIFSSRRARRIGLLSESATEEELDGTINDIVSHILKTYPVAVGVAKQLISDVAQRPVDDELIAQTSACIASSVPEEGQEGCNRSSKARPIGSICPPEITRSHHDPQTPIANRGEIACRVIKPHAPLVLHGCRVFRCRQPGIACTNGRRSRSSWPVSSKRKLPARR